MKKLCSLLLALTLILGLCAFASAEEDGTFALYADNHIQLGSMTVSDGMLAFLFTQSDTTGYVWKAGENTKGLTCMMDDYTAPSEAETWLGIPGQHRMVFVPAGQGSGTLTFWFAKNWIHGYPSVYSVSIPYTVDRQNRIGIGAAVISEGAPISDDVEEQMASDPAFGSITFKSESVELYVGKTSTALSSPKASASAISKKGYTFESSDTAVATVTSEGKVKGIAQGQCTVKVTSKNDPNVWVRMLVKVKVPVSKVKVISDSTSIAVGETLQLSAVIEPANADEQGVTWTTSDKSVATVDENGLVTALKKGSVTIRAKSVDNKDLTGSCKLDITQSVTGVSVEKQYVRVGVNYNLTVTAKFQPSNANNKNMTWYSDDESIATVSGTKADVKIVGRNWGECHVIGITEDGGYQCSFTVLVGSVSKAVSIKNTSITYYGSPYFYLKNDSNLTMKYVHLAVRAYDYEGMPVRLTSEGDGYTLRGDYNYAINPFSSVSCDGVQYIRKLNNNWDGIAWLEVAVTGWESYDSYTTTSGTQSNSYTLGESGYNWVNCGQPLVPNAAN